MSKAAKKQIKYTPPTTYEGWLAEAHAEWASRNRHFHPSPDPTYQYVVGEEAEFHGYKDVRVEEILDGGMRLHLSYQDISKTSDGFFDRGRKPKLAWWFDVIPKKHIEPTAFSRERIRAQYIGTSLDSLIHTCYFRGLLDNPDYQRDYVWTLEDKQRLVRSIFNRCDIGKFVLISFPETEELEVVDGKQRLRAILDFIEGRYPFEGKYWNQLSWKDRHSFNDIMVQYCELDSTMVKKSDILWLFLSINAGGVPQTEEHIAKAKRMYEAELAKENS